MIAPSTEITTAEIPVLAIASGYRLIDPVVLTKDLNSSAHRTPEIQDISTPCWIGLSKVNFNNLRRSKVFL